MGYESVVVDDQPTVNVHASLKNILPWAGS